MNERSLIQGFCAIAVVGPMAAVGVFQFVMNEPANAHANPLKAEFLSLPVIPSWSANSEPAELVTKTMSSPFWFEEIEMSLPVMPTVVRPVEPNVIPDPVFRLSSVLPSASKSFAVINGKTHGVGDEVEPGWVLFKIAGQERFVIIKHTSGRRIRVQMTR